MELPRRISEIIDTLYLQHKALAQGSEDQQRLLTRTIAEQIAFELGPKWGLKRTGPGHPQGPSTIAFLAPPLYVWRWSDGDGSQTGTPGSPLHPALLMPLEQTVNQEFIPVDPIDHLGVGSPMPMPPGAPLPPPVPPPVILEPPPPQPSPPPAPEPPAPSSTATGLQGILTAAGAWLGQQAVSWLIGWFSKRKQPKPVGTVGTAIPRPIPPSRVNLPK